jgi:hypothetical protein
MNTSNGSHNGDNATRLFDIDAIQHLLTQNGQNKDTDNQSSKTASYTLELIQKSMQGEARRFRLGKAYAHGKAQAEINNNQEPDSNANQCWGSIW